METVLLLHPLLDLLICSPLLKSRHVHVFEGELNSDFLARYVSLGKLNNRLDVCSSGKTIHCRIALSINEILAEAGNPLISVPALFYRFYHLIIINIQFKNFVTGLGFAYCALGLQQD